MLVRSLRQLASRLDFLQQDSYPGLIVCFDATGTVASSQWEIIPGWLVYLGYQPRIRHVSIYSTHFW